jgi:peptidoglycan/xylan/chitin deacetylase (PgdA/CDA1 family)
MKSVLFSTSWDDGHPLDLRLAELLEKHGFGGTFYVPGRVAPGGCGNPAGFATVSPTELRAASSRVEIGSHTMDHRFLDAVPIEEARRQVVGGKKYLEDRLGEEVGGFCYPGGRHNAEIRHIVKDAGFRYARTTADLYDRVGPDPMLLPVTVHFFPHGGKDVARSFLQQQRRRFREGQWPERWPLALAASTSSDLGVRLKRVLDRVVKTGGVFHVWGHSWEVDRFGGWSALEDFLRYAAERIPVEARMTNGELIAATCIADRPQASRGSSNSPSVSELHC